MIIGAPSFPTSYLIATAKCVGLVIIADASFTGKGGDGIITVSSVESVLNIASKKTGSEAL